VFVHCTGAAESGKSTFAKQMKYDLVFYAAIMSAFLVVLFYYSAVVNSEFHNQPQSHSPRAAGEESDLELYTVNCCRFVLQLAC